LNNEKVKRDPKKEVEHGTGSPARVPGRQIEGECRARKTVVTPSGTAGVRT